MSGGGRAREESRIRHQARVVRAGLPAPRSRRSPVDRYPKETGPAAEINSVRARPGQTARLLPPTLHRRVDGSLLHLSPPSRALFSPSHLRTGSSASLRTAAPRTAAGGNTPLSCRCTSGGVTPTRRQCMEPEQAVKREQACCNQAGGSGRTRGSSSGWPQSAPSMNRQPSSSSGWMESLSSSSRRARWNGP